MTDSIIIIILHRIFGMFDFRKPFYFIRDPEIIKQLAVKDFDHFENHRSFIDEDVDLLFVRNSQVKRFIQCIDIFVFRVTACLC